MLSQLITVLGRISNDKWNYVTIYTPSVLDIGGAAITQIDARNTACQGKHIMLFQLITVLDRISNDKWNYVTIYNHHHKFWVLLELQ